MIDANLICDRCGKTVKMRAIPTGQLQPDEDFLTVQHAVPDILADNPNAMKLQTRQLCKGCTSELFKWVDSSDRLDDPKVVPFGKA